MDLSSLRCEERHAAVDTTLLLTQALSDMSSYATASDSNSFDTSAIRSEDDSRRRPCSTDESTNAPLRGVSRPPSSTTPCGGAAQNARRQQAETPAEKISLPYTVVPDEADEASRWNLADGFPFPCPVVRDPASRSGLYIPGEILRRRLGKARDQKIQLTQEPEIPRPPVRYEDPMDACWLPTRLDGEKTITLKEVLRQAPIRLSHFRDGETEANLYEAWLYGDPRESLRDRFARMDRGLRSKFIGLKNSSARVRDKVRQKRITTYKEVAEELVEEIGLKNTKDKRSALEAENLKRRVYDVLNVFEAVGLIEKNHKNVYWRGGACPKDDETAELEKEAEKLEAQLQERQRYLQQIKESYGALCGLVERNKHLPEVPGDKINLPFFVLHAPESVPLEFTISPSSQLVQFSLKGEDVQVRGDMWAVRKLDLDRRPNDSARFFRAAFTGESVGESCYASPEWKLPFLDGGVHKHTLHSNGGRDEIKLEEEDDVDMEDDVRHSPFSAPPRKRARVASTDECRSDSRPLYAVL